MNHCVCVITAQISNYLYNVCMPNPNKLLCIQVAELASLAQLLPLRSPTVCNPAPDMQLSVQTAELLLDCVRFSCCSRSRPLRLLLPDCVRFNCCSPITRPLRLLLPDCACWIPANAGPKVLEHSSQSSRFSK